MAFGSYSGLNSGGGLGSGQMFSTAASQAPAMQTQSQIANSTPWWSSSSPVQAPYQTPQTNAFNAYTNYQTALQAPTIAGFDLQNAQQSARLGVIQGATGAGNAAASQQAAIAKQKIDNNIASNQIDINAIPSQIKYNNDVYGVNGQQYQSVANMVDQLTANQQNIFNTAAGQANLTLQGQQRDWGNDTAGRGSSSAPETGQKLADFQSQNDFAVQAAREAQTEQDARLANHKNQALYDYTLQGLSTTQQNARLNDRGQQLDLLAKNYGLDKQALLASLNAQLANSNLNGILTAGQVLDGINSNNIQKAQLMNDIVYGAVQYANGQGNGSSAPAYSNASGGLPNIGSNLDPYAGGARTASW